MRWPVVVAVGLFICVAQFGLLFVAMNTGLPAGLASVIAPLQPVFTIPLAALAAASWGCGNVVTRAAETKRPFTLLVPVIGIFTAWLVRGEHPIWGEVPPISRDST